MGQSHLNSSVNSGLLSLRKVTNTLELSLQSGVKAQWDASPGIQSRPYQHKEESLCLQSSVLTALLKRYVWDSAQQHILVALRAESPVLPCRVRVGKGGRPSAHTCFHACLCTPLLISCVGRMGTGSSISDVTFRF